MCGILGHIRHDAAVDPKLFQHMLDTLSHRGPDGEGSILLQNNKIALGHRRLSFLDLGDAGRQPMYTNKKDKWISFNGEIYNYLELKSELKLEYEFRTETDTEVILAAYQKWGENCVSKLKGMFAFAILDLENQKLFLARDRFGIKPLYYGEYQGEFLFASELKPLIKSGSFPKEIDKSAMADFFVYRYVPSPKSIWKHIKKLPPAHTLSLSLNDFSLETKEYWKLESEESNCKESELVNEAEQIIKQSIKTHLRADVPIGAFLSGGYDSSALAAWMKEAGKSPDTFSIGFKNWEKSEDQFAKTVANHLHLHNDSIQANDDSLNLMEIMPQVYDEPIADISIIPTYLVSQLARKKVKAVFSGEGADEIFGGYGWQHNYFEKTYSTSLKQRLKNLFATKKPVQFYAESMAMGWFDKHELQNMFTNEFHTHLEEDVHWFYRKHFRKDLSPMKSIQQMDIKCFMGELVLTKIDRASMANSLEVRVPFLDHKLFEKVFSCQEKNYLKPNQTKFVLYQLIKELLPKAILKRKKQGFVGPDSYYMNIDYYKKELQNSALVSDGIIHSRYLNKLLKEKYNWKLWKILVMEKWYKQWAKEASS